ncbi:hypothetical protein LGT39_08235 [Demequina sp. TTPB684]|uniref:hypothetical protein n=1 Tax=unclassified Demequina TaxID=2620311 RepID=UPI001CF5D5E8|nr:MULTISPECIES: hypothetical protein [unclassified Demequina]MCB2412832.1 hypothetical protein [Demequina sp. TTPB684]UPU87537.1 hypothetical protein LGT36_009730 [Demequina sp. TMPB413]
MSRSRRVELAREALPSVTAWAELVIGPGEEAHHYASDAVVAAASASGIASVTELGRAAREHIARRLAGGISAIPVARDADERDGGTPPDAEVHELSAAASDGPEEASGDSRSGRHPDTSPYAPGNAHSAYAPPSADERHPADSAVGAGADEIRETPAHRTPAERLADALAGMPPHERLASVRFYLDGEPVDSIAALFRIEREAAVSLLESVTDVLAPIVGEHDLPDFSARADATEIEVVTR